MRSHPTPVRLGFAAALALTLMWAAHAVVDPLGGLGVDPVIVVGEVGTLVLCAGILTTRAAGAPRGERLAWLLLGLGLWLAAAGTLSAHLRAARPQDAGLTPWELTRLAGYAPIIGGLVLLIRTRISFRHAGSWLDGAVAALCAQALLGMLWIDRLVDLAGRAGLRLDAETTAILLLACDLLLLGLATGAVAHAGRRVAGWWPLLGAAAGVAVSDSAYLTRLAAGTWVPAQLWDAGWMLAALLLATAAWTPATADPGRAAAGPRSEIPVVPALLALALLATAAMAPRAHPVTALAAAASLLAAVLRLRLSLRENDRLLAAAAREALVDPLTGLGNRRAFEADLEGVLGAADEHVLALVDVDAFKTFNDAHGHLAGDLLLQDVARHLSAHRDSRAYRIGGDEFCVLAPARAGTPIGEALVPSGADDAGTVRLSVGSARIPVEARTPAGALALADERMYAAKRP